MAVIEKRELQEDGHYQVSCYDSGSQKLTHRWLETEGGKKDGMEVEYVSNENVIHLINWKNGKKDGIEAELYAEDGNSLARDLLGEDYSYEIKRLNRYFNGYEYMEYIKEDILPIGVKSITNWKDGRKDGKELICDSKKRIASKNEYKNGKIIKDKSIIFEYPVLKEAGYYTWSRRCIEYTSQLHKYVLGDDFKKLWIKTQASNPKSGISLDQFDDVKLSYLCIGKNPETKEIIKIRFYGYHSYDMTFKDGHEYEGSYKHGDYCYTLKAGKLNGKYCMRDNNGDEFSRYYENGNLVKEYWYTSDSCLKERWPYDDNGVLNGFNIKYNRSGDVIKKCFYKDGKLEGDYLERYNNTKTHIEAFYKDGKLEGDYREFNEHGKVIKQCSYKDGKLDGDYRDATVSCHYKNGKLDGRYTDSLTGTDLVYENGKIISGVKREHGKIYTYENADEYTLVCQREERHYAVTHTVTISSSHYKNGLLDGLYQDFENGIEAYYKEGKKNGLCVEDTKYGKKESTYKDDVLDGQYIEYFTNGKKKCEGNYSNGNKNGFWKIYADNGDLIETRRFENGKDVTERYNKLKKIAAKHIEAEKKEEAKKVAKTGEKVRVTHNNHSLKGKFQKMIDKVTHDL